ncbi:uncharacterized protein UTRI_04145_B [Ustilago trichophora]|uniref:Myb-like domain-containing protein n=1 Tax=Ustilago trichophora TaxID=86804 RepID=A0A5C3E8F5_9BASI|nr:uncharacterized protein UTRI_04145_B [Ustilago trichophora]
MATKVDEPWTDNERFLIVQHVLKHADYSKLFDAIAADLVENGCPVRKKSAYQAQWRRKISKDILGLYEDKPSVTPVGSPSKRKRKEEPRKEEFKKEEFKKEEFKKEEFKKEEFKKEEFKKEQFKYE